MKNVNYLSELPPHLAEIVRAFRAEMVAEREEQERRLREALEHYKIEFDYLRREAEIDIAVCKRFFEMFKETQQSKVAAARPPQLG